VDFLESSNSIKKVFWAYQKENNFSFQKMAGEEKSGCVVSFEVKGDFKSFYNQLRMLKSPSFGTEFSLCCPYVYLAHYQMTKSVKGIEQLKKAGISPYLCRLSVGLEDPSEIVSTLEDALRQMKR
jgi:cystathionine gamma-synthase